VLDLLATAKLGNGEFTAGIENLLNTSYVVAERQAFNDFFDYGRAEGTRVTLGFQAEF
jgi:outer membrane receptor protein involved in Fe transport